MCISQDDIELGAECECLNKVQRTRKLTDLSLAELL